MDIRSFQISNRLIVSGFLIGCFFQIQESGVKGASVFLMRVLGAGDIKLFSMIGGFWGLQLLCTTIAASFLVAAVMSLGKMLFHRNLILRLQVFRGYMLEVLASGRLLRYPQESQGERHIIHFSIAILIGYAIAMEVAY